MVKYAKNNIIYGFTFRNELYQQGKVGINLYSGKSVRDTISNDFKDDGFVVYPFELIFSNEGKPVKLAPSEK